MERAGISRDLCAYMRNYWGSVLIDKFLLGDGTIVDGFPKADLLFSIHVCCSHAKWYQFVRDAEGGVPYRAIDGVVFDKQPQLDDPALDYQVQQALEAIDWMEKTTGRKYNDELLFEAIYNDLDSISLWSQIEECNHVIPAPIDQKLMFAMSNCMTTSPHREESVEFLTDLLDEMKDRVKRGIAAVGDEQVRFLIDNTPVWGYLGFFRHLEKAWGAAGVGGTYSATFSGWERDEEGNLHAAKRPREKGDYS